MSDFTVEYSDDGGSTYTTINYQTFGIDYGVSDVLLAPIASVDVARTVGASTGDRLRIQEDGTTRFEGRLTTGGKVNRNGQTKLQAEHDIYPVFEDSVSITVSNPTDEDVYNAALSAANGGGGFTLNYVGTPVSLGDDYSVEDRSVKRIFRDMTDRTDRVFFVGVGDTITVDTRGGGGQFASVSSGDSFRVEQYNPGDINTVRNAVTVNGTGGERVTATAENSTSISDFGRRAETFNYSYIRTATEAQDMADELLVPSPLASGEILLGQSVGGGATGEIVNQTLDFDDPQGSGASDTLTIERQIINPGSVTVNVGEGAGVSIANVNREAKSDDDRTEPGSVYNSDRIADNSIDSNQLVDSSVITSKLDDLAVELQKVADGAIDTVKITDEAVEAPKILAGTITANEIAADTITANEIVAGTITALELAADSVTANEIAANSIDADKIDTLDLATNELTIGDAGDEKVKFREDAGGDETLIIPTTEGTCGLGSPGEEFGTVYTNFAGIRDGDFGSIFNEQINIVDLGGTETGLQPTTDGTCQLGSSGTEYSSVWAKDFYSEGSVVATDGADLLAGLAEAVEPPDHCIERGDDGSTKVSISSLAEELWSICTAQQRRIDDLEDRLSKLEAQQ